MNVRHGKSKDLMTAQPYKMLPFAQICVGVYKPMLPELICMIDFMVMRDQLPSGMKSISCTSLTGRDKKAKAERKVEDVGLIPLCLAKISVRNATLARWSCKIRPKHDELYEDIVVYEMHVPSE